MDIPLPVLLLISICALGRLTSASLPSPLGNFEPRAPVSDLAKAGLAWPNGDNHDIAQFPVAGSKISWYYTWSAWPIGNRRPNYRRPSGRPHAGGLEFVPMLWGPRTADEFRRNINTTLDSGDVSAVLGVNEPEQSGQANMTPSEGVALWKTYMEPLRISRPALRLGSPGVSSAPEGKRWLQDWFRECGEDCTVDFVALHWYGTDPHWFIAHLWDYHYTFAQRPLWVTEWACHDFVDGDSQCSGEAIRDFMNITQAFMDEVPWVERYAWFGAMTDMNDVNTDNALMDVDGEINDLGRQYSGNDGPFEVYEDDSGALYGPAAGWMLAHTGLLFATFLSLL